MRRQTMDWDTWAKELVRVAVEKCYATEETAHTIDLNAFRESYYDNGLTPEEAIDEDCSYA